MLFKHTDYIKLLQEINTLGKCKLFKENILDQNVFLVRHDIDFSLKLAYDMAKIEHDNGIVATYFILTTCNRYNILAPESREYLSKIKELNHEIALHFDPTLYAENKLEEAVKIEADILAFAANCEIKSISLHNPSLHGKYPLFNGYVNAYDPKLFSDDNYISDSCFSFRGKDPFEYIKKIKESTIQILIHPLHFSEMGGGYKDIFAKEFSTIIYQHHLDYVAANYTYKDQLDGSFKGFKEALIEEFNQKTE